MLSICRLNVLILVAVEAIVHLLLASQRDFLLERQEAMDRALTSAMRFGCAWVYLSREKTTPREEVVGSRLKLWLKLRAKVKGDEEGCAW